MPVKRFDAGRIDKAERTPQGGLRVPAFPTRAGVLVYLNPDGTERRELRPPDEVFKVDSLRTMHGAPVTDLHPKDAVTPENWRTLSVGHVAEDVKQDGEHVSSSLLVQDANMIRMIEAGERQECSCGYSCDIDLTPGVYQGQPYDTVQRNIVYNHVALGPADWGRAGPTVALRLDSGDAVEKINKRPENPAEQKKVMAAKVRIDGIEYEVGTDSYLQAVERRDSQQRARIAELETSNAALTKEKDTEKGRADALDKSNKDLTEKLKTATDPKTIHAAAKTRADMLDKCRRAHRLNGLRFDEVAAEAGSVEDMLLSAVKAMDPNFDANGKTPEYIRAAFEILFAQMIARAGGTETETEEPEITEPADGAPLDNSGGNGAPPRQDSRGGGTDIYTARRGTGGNRQDGGKKDDPADPDAAFNRMIQDNRDRGMRPLRGSAKK